MEIAIIDADLIGRKKHRFPNLACMKLSGYHKGLGYTVELKLDFVKPKIEEGFKRSKFEYYLDEFERLYPDIAEKYFDKLY